MGYSAAMETRAPIKDREGRFKPPSVNAQSEAGYDKWLATEIEAGCGELDAGQGIPAKQVWKELGLS